MFVVKSENCYLQDDWPVSKRRDRPGEHAGDSSQRAKSVLTIISATDKMPLKLIVDQRS